MSDLAASPMGEPGNERELLIRREAPNPPDLAERILRAAQLAHPIYVAHGWTWGGTTTPKEIPSVERLADRIKQMYDEARDSEAGVISTGRLSVYRVDDSGEMAVDVQLEDLRDEVPGWDDAMREAELERLMAE